MKLRLVLAVACFTLGSAALSAVAQATTVDLAADLYTVNTGGAWSMAYSGGPLTLFPKSSVANNNHLYSAVPTEGIISSGAAGDMNANTPFVFKAAVDGSATAPDPANHSLTDGDFLAGDVVVHSPNSGILTITWEAPTAGVISNLDFAVWYAHSTQPTRSNDISFSVGSLMANNLITSASANSTRPDPFANNGIINGGSTAVAAGQLLSLTFAKSASADFGSLSGLALRFDFQTAVTPIPATLPLFVSALAGLGWFAHRRRKEAV